MAASRRGSSEDSASVVDEALTASAELVREGRFLGLDMVDLRTRNYFDSEKASNPLHQRLERIMPKTPRAGITVVYRAPGAGNQ